MSHCGEGGSDACKKSSIYPKPLLTLSVEKTVQPAFSNSFERCPSPQAHSHIKGLNFSTDIRILQPKVLWHNNHLFVSRDSNDYQHLMLQKQNCGFLSNLQPYLLPPKFLKREIIIRIVNDFFKIGCVGIDVHTALRILLVLCPLCALCAL